MSNAEEPDTIPSLVRHRMPLASTAGVETKASAAGLPTTAREGLLDDVLCPTLSGLGPRAPSPSS